MTEAEIAFTRARQIDALCDKFEHDWKAGLRPEVEAFAAAATESERDAARSALQSIERELQERSIADTSVTGSSVATGAGPIDATALHTPGSAIPVEIGRFAIRGLLGAGAFGQVYRAFDPQLGREVAVKTPIASIPSSAKETARFLKEARAAATMNHSNICQIHEVGEHAGRPYIVMPLIRGESLAETLKQRSEPLKSRQIALIVRKLALALAAAHAKGIVHRDLKPANIMFDRERKDLLVMDFGLARGPHSAGAGATQSGIVMGTPAYMSPEQARGDSKVGPAGDIYSLGVILYELLTGTRPYNGTATEVIGQILHVEPEAPSRRRAGVDPLLEAACLRAMAKDPAARFASMREFAVAVDAALKQPSGSTPAAAIETARAKETRRESAADGQGSANMSELFAVLSAERKTQQAATVAAVDAAVRRSRTPPWMIVVVGLLLAGGLSALAGIVFFTRSDNVKVTIKLTDVDLADKTLSFFLDDVLISAEKLANPVELKPGEHILVVKRGKEVVKRMLLTVTGRPSPGITVEDITDDGFTSLFNGKDLSGWMIESGDAKNWNVRDGAIVGSTPADNPAESWLLSEQDYRDCIVRFEFKADSPEADSGLALRAVPGEKQPAAAGGGTSIKPTHFQIKISGDDVKRENIARQTGTVLGTLNVQLAPTAIIPANPQGKQKPVGKWNRMEVDLLGQTVRVRVNGEVVTDGNLNDLIARGSKFPGLSRKGGRIGFQRRRGTFQFRNIRIKEFADGFVPLFNGKDLAGWTAIGKPNWRWAEDRAVAESEANSGIGLLLSDQEYDDFEIRLQFRLADGAGSGLLLRTHDDVLKTRGQLEVQLLSEQLSETQLPINKTGSIYSVFARQADPPINKSAFWNDLRVRLEKQKIQVWINDVQTIDRNLDDARDQFARMPGLTRTKGKIGLQQSHQPDVEFRNAFIKPLRDGQASAKEVAPKVDHDRVAAEYILSVGGKVSINFQPRIYTKIETLPGESFQLTAISLNGNKQATNVGIAVVKECKQLRNLDLGGSQITDVGLAHFKDHVNITHLGLPYMKMTDEGLANFKNCKELNSLVVHDTKVTDVGLAYFQDCKNLETLWVSGLPVTDEVVTPFANCKYMKWIDLRATKVTSEGYRKLRAALPNCIIGVNPGIQ